MKQCRMLFIWIFLFFLSIPPLRAEAVPLLIDHQPVSDSTVLPASTVSATFSEAMDSLSISRQSFIVTKPVRVTAIAAGGNHSLALRDDGTVVGWGVGPSASQRNLPETRHVISIAAATSADVFVQADGTLTGWGDSWYGTPNAVPGAIAVAAGDFGEFYALKSDGSVVNWGGTPAPPLTLRSVKDISVKGTKALVIIGSKRKLAQWQGSTVLNTPDLVGVTAIAEGYYHSLAVQNGRVIAWPTVASGNNYGQCDVPPELTDVVAVAAGMYHSLALKSDGTVIAWGSGRYGQNNPPAGLTEVVAIAAGDNHSLALTKSGEVVGWGYNGDGQITLPTGLYGVIDVVRGNATMALKYDGTVTSWGKNWYGQTDLPTDLADVAALDAGAFNMALRTDGSVVTWGRRFTGAEENGAPVTVPADPPPSGLGKVKDISVQGHFLAVKEDGSVAAWGSANMSGELDIPLGLTDVASVTANYSNSFAVKRDGSVVRWGYFSTSCSDMPANLSGVKKIYAYSGRTIALIQDGTIVSWGCDGWWPYVISQKWPSTAKVMDIAINNNWTYVLTDEGKVYSFDAISGTRTEYNQGFPRDLSDAVAVATEGFNNTVVRADGSILSWGFSGTDIHLHIEPTVSLYEGRVSGNVVYDAATSTALFTPEIPLAAGTYEAKLFARNAAGEILRPVSWIFTVTSPPTSRTKGPSKK